MGRREILGHVHADLLQRAGECAIHLWPFLTREGALHEVMRLTATFPVGMTYVSNVEHLKFGLRVNVNRLLQLPE